jgi:arsenical pump membrane protein
VAALAAVLATLLWRRALRERDAEPPGGEFLHLGAFNVPAALAAAPRRCGWP